MSDDELVQRARVSAILDELGVEALPIRRAMLAEPRDALVLLDRVRSTHGIRNPAAYVTARWRKRAERQRRPALPAPELVVDAQAEPPTLSAIEHAWAREPSPAVDALLTAMGAAIHFAGGFKALQDSFYQRDRYDERGELVEREQLPRELTIDVELASRLSGG